MQQASMRIIALGTACVICACGAPQSEEYGVSEDPVTGTRTDRSLVVTDPEILSAFGFARTMGAIRSSALLPGESFAASSSRLGIYQRWMRSFGTGTDGCDRTSIDPEKYGLTCPRPPELQLASLNPFATNSSVTFVPVGLFNRFDLMPTDGATCGEYRIVYAMRASATLSGRAFIIFEAALPNPTPALGPSGCLPVARFWQRLTNDANVGSRKTKLEDFYYNGTAIAGFPAVVQARNYGLAGSSGPAISGRPGQIRTNFFVDFREWHLREFKLLKRCPSPATCGLLFDHQTVKTNPAEELFAGTHDRSGAFRRSFVGQVRRLAKGNIDTISMGVTDVFNEFESVSQSDNVLYNDGANPAMRTVIQAELTRLGSRLTVTDILNRATTQTCAGCHQVSTFPPNNALGGRLVWPGTLGFVHIDESSNLSPALTDVFLPRRLSVLEAFINNVGAVVSASDETIDGRPIDAAN